MEKKVFKQSLDSSWLRSDQFMNLVYADVLDCCRFTYFGGKCPFSNLTCHSCPYSYAYEKRFSSYQDSAKERHYIIKVVTITCSDTFYGY